MNSNRRSRPQSNNRRHRQPHHRNRTRKRAASASSSLSFSSTSAPSSVQLQLPSDIAQHTHIRAATHHKNTNFSPHSLLDGNDYYLPLSGRYRSNILLMKSPVGHTKPSLYNLPSSEHRYGKANPKKEIDTSNIVNGWNVGIRTADQRWLHRKKDFTLINRRALKRGCVTAKQVNQYRREQIEMDRAREMEHQKRTREQLRIHNNNNSADRDRERERSKSCVDINTYAASITSTTKATTKEEQPQKQKKNIYNVDVNKLVHGIPSSHRNQGEVIVMKEVMEMGYHKHWLRDQIHKLQSHIVPKASRKGIMASVPTTKASRGHALFMSHEQQNNRMNKENREHQMRAHFKHKYSHVNSKLQITGTTPTAFRRTNQMHPQKTKHRKQLTSKIINIDVNFNFN